MVSAKGGTLEMAYILSAFADHFLGTSLSGDLLITRCQLRRADKTQG